VLEQHKKMMAREVSKRALVLAQQITATNAISVKDRQEAKLDLGAIPRVDSVRVAAIVDLDLRIMAPARLANQYLTMKPEGPILAKMVMPYSKGFQQAVSAPVSEDLVIAIDPIRVFNPASGENQIVALSVVSMTTKIVLPTSGDEWSVLSYALILSTIVGLFLFYVLYRVTLKPLEEMNTKVDSLLRGEMVEFKSAQKFSELAGLWEVIDSALKRIPRTEISSASESSDSPDAGQAIEQGLRAICLQVKQPSAIVDRAGRLIAGNASFEEITGIRIDQSIGSSLSQAARDQAFAQVVQEQLARITTQQMEATDDIDFSGVAYRVVTTGHGGRGGISHFLILLGQVENG
jgi:PAS domain-containing protein